MICEKCSKEFSDAVYQLHILRCKKEDKKEDKKEPKEKKMNISR